MSAPGVDRRTDQDRLSRQRNTRAFQHHNSENSRIAITCENMLSPRAIKKIHFLAPVFANVTMELCHRPRRGSSRERKPRDLLSSTTLAGSLGQATRYRAALTLTSSVDSVEVVEKAPVAAKARGTHAPTMSL